MAYFRVCPYCGGNLDPGEKCDCQDVKEAKSDFYKRHLKMEPRAGQLAFVFGGKEDDLKTDHSVL